MTANQGKEFIRYFPSAVMCLDISRKRRITCHVKGASEARYRKSQMPSTSFFFPASFFCWVSHHLFKRWSWWSFWVLYNSEYSMCACMCDLAQMVTEIWYRFCFNWTGFIGVSCLKVCNLPTSWSVPASCCLTMGAA